ncbi:ComEA family DNA-binding protein [Foetidibacter luteolus]|uniref:ComEA family DNA-binding protein n=1 Tax=Foetidibacter luteolus TaxID=2608880 RepID=UPI00129BB3C8|nr:helix-hairpin-helix domain-containing protein [Foetidibacter luteolus]
MKDSWKDYFAFSKKEKIAVIVLLLAVGLFIVLPFLFPAKTPEITVEALTESKLPNITTAAADTLAEEHVTAVAFQPEQTEKPPTELFYFNPNTLDEAGWKKLGLKEKNIRTILNYRSKGGRFRKPEDLRKIYGLPADLADKLVPYVRLEETPSKKAEELPVAATAKADTVQKVSKASTIVIKPVRINSATAEEWKELPGIGDVLGNRIVKFRTKIGGFTSVDQVGKTYGLADSVFQKIKPYLVLE